jgi:hypothetical protein
VPTNGPDKAHVIAFAPLIVVATLALGLFPNFVWPMRFLARTDALWLGALLIVVSIPIVIGAAWQLTKAMLLALPLALILQQRRDRARRMQGSSSSLD